MAENGILISYDDVKAISDEIEIKNVELGTILEDIEANVVKVKPSWNTKSADLFLKEIQGMKSTFDNYKEKITTYTKFLKNTCSGYENVDKSHTSMFD